MKIVCIVQARVGSTRLPGKVLKLICGKTVLEHDINRLKKVRNIDEIVIATTIGDADIAIVKEANRLGIKYFRGSEEDVLSRYYYAARESNADIVVRVTSDCPCIDSNIVEKIIDRFKELQVKDNLDYINNTLQLTFPRGYDVEVFTFKALEMAFNKADEVYEREHVTPYIYSDKNDFKIEVYKNKENYSDIRLTLDTPEDFKLITDVYEKLYEKNNVFTLEEVIDLYKNEPKLFEYNKHIIQKKMNE